MAHYNLGNTLHDQEKWDEAIAAYRKAIELDPKYALAHGNLGIALSHQEKLDEAIVVFRKAVEINPKRAIAHYNLGAALDNQNKRDEAIASFRKAFEIDPKHPKPKTALAKTLARRGWELPNHSDPEARDLDRALELCKQAVEIDPQSRYGWHRLGWVYYRAGSWQESIGAMEKAGKLLARGNGDGTGDATEWIVFALAHARLAAQPNLPEQERVRHQTEALRWYEKADEMIDKWSRVRPDNDPTTWDPREEATKLLGIQKQKPEVGS